MNARDAALISAMGHEIAERDTRIEVLEQRIAALEDKMAQWRYCGVWSEGQQCEVGNFVTHEGSLFTCLWSTQSKPGTDSSWQLCCKRGKDGRDGKDLPRQATQERTYGR